MNANLTSIVLSLKIPATKLYKIILLWIHPPNLHILYNRYVRVNLNWNKLCVFGCVCVCVCVSVYVWVGVYVYLDVCVCVFVCKSSNVANKEIAKNVKSTEWRFLKKPGYYIDFKEF